MKLLILSILACCFVQDGHPPHSWDRMRGVCVRFRTGVAPSERQHFRWLTDDAFALPQSEEKLPKLIWA